MKLQSISPYTFPFAYLANKQKKLEGWFTKKSTWIKDLNKYFVLFKIITEAYSCICILFGVLIFRSHLIKDSVLPPNIVSSSGPVPFL